MIWLPHGLSADHATDGHVDNVAQFIRPGVVMLQTDTDPRSPDHEPLQENVERLRSGVDARGRAFEVIELDLLPRAEIRGRPGCVPYLHLYLVKGGVIVPACGTDPDRDQQALQLIANAFAPREVVPVPGLILAAGGGGCTASPSRCPRGLSHGAARNHCGTRSPALTARRSSPNPTAPSSPRRNGTARACWWPTST